jgi:transposase
MTAVGIDLGETTSYATIWEDERGETFPFPMTSEGYALLKQKLRADARIVFESSGTAYPFHRQLRELGFENITVAHPKELAWIVRSKKKNDKVDSVKLAKLHSVGMIPEAHLLGREDQTFRDLVVQRVKLGAEIAELKTTLVGYLKREGLFDTLPDTADNFSSSRRKAIRKLALGHDRELVFATLMDRLEHAEGVSERFEARIKVRARDNEDVRILMSIPGVNFYLASLVCSYIGDVRRFPDADHLASYFGIVPAERNSSSMKRVGRMSKDGPNTARKALSIMVDTVAKCDGRIREYYARAKIRTGSGKMAHVVTMKKLVRMLYAMLSKRERWARENEGLTARKLASLDSD